VGARASGCGYSCWGARGRARESRGRGVCESVGETCEECASCGVGEARGATLLLQSEPWEERRVQELRIGLDSNRGKRFATAKE
jgi:hypothetical protein